MTAWLAEVRAELTAHEAVLAASRPSLGQQQRMKTMRDALGRCHDGQQYLAAASGPAELLLAELAPTAREAVRAELRALRDDWERLLDGANQALKRLDALVLQLSSFDDCFRQVAGWLEKMEAQVEEEPEPRATLSEKAALLRDELARRQEVLLREHMVSQLRQRAAQAADVDAPAEQLSDCLRRYDSLQLTVAERAERAQTALERHQRHARAQQAVADWLADQQGRLAAALADGESSDALLAAVESLQGRTEAGLSLLRACEASLAEVRPETATDGRPALERELGQLQAEYHRHISELSELRFRQQAARQQQQQQQQSVRELADWLLRQEEAASEPPPLDTLPEKTTEANRLEGLCTEIGERQLQLQQLPSSGQLQPLQARCQQLQTQLQERAARSRQMVVEHEEYDTTLAHLYGWLEQAQAQLDDNSAVVGQPSVLKERRRRLEELSDEWCRRGGDVDAALSLGERLYAHTGPLGRETVRSRNTDLRASWERLSDRLQQSCGRLDDCLQQLAEFGESQEQLTRWLRDVEQAMAAHAQLRGTLQEKQAQLQSHELTHQEIGAHQALVADVCRRARELIVQTQDTSLQAYVTSIQALFDTIRLKSQEILEHLSECVRRHDELQTASRQQQVWLTAQRDQLLAADDVSGEPAAVQQRRDAVRKAQPRLAQGRRQMKQIHDACVHTLLGTSESGGTALQAAVTALDDDWKAFENQFATADRRLKETLDQWSDYERRQKQLAAWCAEHEQLFSQLQLQATLDEKVEVLRRLSAARQAIVEREADVDELIDRGNGLAQLSGLERLNSQVKQLSARYQELHVTSQTLLTKWQNMVDDQRAYDEKLAEAQAWLQQPADDQPEDGQRLVSSLCALGERLFPSSSAAGRDLVRQQMRAARDTWEAHQADTRAARQEAAARSQAELSCAEALHQVDSWLESAERLLATEPASWLSASDLKTKAHKLKDVQSDEAQYRRLLDGLEPRHPLLAEPARRALQDAAARLQTVSAETRQQRERLDSLLDQLTAHQELVRAHHDWSRATHDQIHAVSDTAGGRTALGQRRSRLSQWSSCEAALESVVGWLNEAEATLKNHYTHKSTLEEKGEQLKKFQDLDASLLQQEGRLDKLAADVQELSRSSGDNRMTFIVQQAVSRANNVQVMTKDLLSRYEEGVQEHRAYVQQYNTYLAEFSGYQERFAAVQVGLDAGGLGAESGHRHRAELAMWFTSSAS
ncbi:nesprin-1-like [Pollicipes pollicipes]|uniref:nesprin-1-like n=1 Tax=Pollicipes pollicipes TaxID=41117 RepID=UPI00188579C3|nr:nesprin-1-like [Pollicipes pollicipes]